MVHIRVKHESGDADLLERSEDDAAEAIKQIETQIRAGSDIVGFLVWEDE